MVFLNYFVQIGHRKSCYIFDLRMSYSIATLSSHKRNLILTVFCISLAIIQQYLTEHMYDHFSRSYCHYNSILSRESLAGEENKRDIQVLIPFTHQLGLLIYLCLGSCSTFISLYCSTDPTQRYMPLNQLLDRPYREEIHY